MSIVSLADRLNDLMLAHANNEVENNSIQRDYIEGFVVELPSSGSNVYKVKINKDIYSIPCRDGLVLAKNDIVIIALYNGNFNKKWIDLKRPW